MARNKIGLMIELDPDRARAMLREELRRHRWSARSTAATLGVGWTTVKRWVERLGLRGEVDAGQQRTGSSRGGRPKGKPRARAGETEQKPRGKRGV